VSHSRLARLLLPFHRSPLATGNTLAGRRPTSARMTGTVIFIRELSLRSSFYVPCSLFRFTTHRRFFPRSLLCKSSLCFVIPYGHPRNHHPHDKARPAQQAVGGNSLAASASPILRNSSVLLGVTLSQ